jgi:hypothetical protein
VTQSRGEKYLWVDCLCIKQGSAVDLAKFIPRMDLIYGFASVIIVAASGADADAGLPGIKSNSRTLEPKPICMSNGVWLLRTLDPAGSTGVNSYSYLQDSTWCERGWTFQEKLFSKRALIFTPEQVF